MTNKHDKEFDEVFDMVLQAKDLSEDIQAKVKTTMEHANAILTLMRLERISTSGEIIRDANIGILKIESAAEIIKACVGSADEALSNAAMAMARLEFSKTIQLDPKLCTDAEKERYQGLWRAKTESEDIAVLDGQISRLIDALLEVLPI